jgi:enamine deaminase RidA (YjgF/YER057c/UK114 family)
MKIEKRLEELKITLPPIGSPLANYVPCRRAGNLLFLSGRGPGGNVSGKVGDAISTEEAYQHARSVGLGLIAVMKHELGDLDKVKGIMKVLGMVNAAPTFRDHPKVINGCSDLLVEVFGDAGRHARSAVGMGSLPNQIPVEIELIALVE